MYLRKAQAGSAPGHHWEMDGSVLEVDDDLAYELLAIPGGGFSEAEPARDEEGEDAPKKKPGRPPLPRDEDGNIIRKTEIAE